MPRPLRWLKGSRRLPVLAGVLTLVLGLGAGVVIADPGHWFSNDNDWPYNNPGPAPVLAAVGDISCQPAAAQQEKASDICSGGTEKTTRDAAQAATGQQVEDMHPALVAVLGDEQYQNGLYGDFESSFDQYWGGSKMLQRPAPGNHEYYDNHGQAGVRGVGYFDYYNGITHNADGSQVTTTISGSSVQKYTEGATAKTVTVTNADNSTTTVTVPAGTGSYSATIPENTTQPAPEAQGQAGDTGQGWYSYNLGDWHLISLNIECEYQLGGCNPSGSWFLSETNWLKADLQQNHEPCIAAYWHQPTFSSTAGLTANGMGDSTEGDTADAWWKILYAAHATLILNGHDHVYTRFAPMDPAGNADPKNGIREFIIGTGGESLDTLAATPATAYPMPSTVQKAADKWYGVAGFTLGDGWYKWDYRSAMEDPAFTTDAQPPAPATTFTDSGTGLCNGSNGIGGHGDQGNND